MRLTALMLVLLFAAPAVAEERGSAQRYAFVRVEAGALRLDTATGDVWLCHGGDGAPGCSLLVEATPDGTEGAAELEAQIEALDRRIAELEARIAALEAAAERGEFLSDEEAMDRVLALSERMMRRLFGMVRDMQREMEGEEL
jgi:hypothetical protein